MQKRIRLSPDDLQIVQEALSYMGRRFFAPGDSRMILEIEDALDAARRAADGGRADLQLPRSHTPLLRRVLQAYADELDHPSSDSSNRSRISRLRRLSRRAAGGGSLWGNLRRWFGRG